VEENEMKILLRKVRLTDENGRFVRDLFKPVKFPEYSSGAVSLTANPHSPVFFAIVYKYGLNLGVVDNLAGRARSRREVTCERLLISAICVPATFRYNGVKIERYARQLCDHLQYFPYLHFTHFCHLKDEFPEDQIRKILNVFRRCNLPNIQICWDIDYKFAEQMSRLLMESQDGHGLSFDNNIYNPENFDWYVDDSNTRQTNPIYCVEHLLRLAGQNMATNRQTTSDGVNRLPRIGSGPAGVAGEHYALHAFTRHGFLACKAPEGTATYDLMVMHRNGQSFAPVQVKTITNGRHWILFEDHENVVDGLIFCFISFGRTLNETRTYLLPSEIVSNVIRTCHQIYLRIPRRNGEARQGGSMRTLKTDCSTLINGLENPSQYLSSAHLRFLRNHGPGWMDRYENNFSLIGEESRYGEEDDEE
jgi:hypothetical protein